MSFQNDFGMSKLQYSCPNMHKSAASKNVHIANGIPYDLKIRNSAFIDRVLR